MEVLRLPPLWFLKAEKVQHPAEMLKLPKNLVSQLLTFFHEIDFMKKNSKKEENFVKSTYHIHIFWALTNTFCL